MQKTLALMVLAALPGGMAFAADYPTVETFLGYTYMRANSATDVPAFSANGGSGQLDVNFNKYLGVVMDIGAVHNGNINNHQLDSTFVNYLWGPRVSIRHGRITPYFNILFGGMYVGSSFGVTVVAPPTPTNPIVLPGDPNPVPPNTSVGLRAVHSQTAFAMTVGGGLDIKINKHVSFRPIGLDYMLTRLQNVQDQQDRNQNNLRYTTGLNFTFGAQ
jgi:opacity protein-like surface antigen